jgi:HTH-type transcriptional regulator / antitoxin HigA
MNDFDDFFVFPKQSSVSLEQLLIEIKMLKEKGLIENGDLSNLSSILLSGNAPNYSLFRKSNPDLTQDQLAWISKAAKIGSSYSGLVGRQLFSGFQKVQLQNIVKFSARANGIDLARIELMKAGIFLFFIQAPTNSKIDGATFKVSNDNIAIAMSLRFDRIDYFWFTLLHELSHIILHSEFLEEGILSEEGDFSVIEAQANRLAKDAIISPASFRTLKSRLFINDNHLLPDAQKFGIHPALIAGIIRNDTNNYTVYSDVIYKSRYNRSDLYE